MNQVWGIKKPQTKQEHHRFIRELCGAMEDLKRLGFEARFDFSAKDILLVVRTRRTQT